jgi:hypothetical protein
MPIYEDKSGMRVRRIPRLTPAKLLGIRLAVANATAFHVGEYEPYINAKCPQEIVNGSQLIPRAKRVKE